MGNIKDDCDAGVLDVEFGVIHMCRICVYAFCKCVICVCLCMYM